MPRYLVVLAGIALVLAIGVLGEILGMWSIG